MVRPPSQPDACAAFQWPPPDAAAQGFIAETKPRATEREGGQGARGGAGSSDQRHRAASSHRRQDQRGRGRIVPLPLREGGWGGVRTAIIFGDPHPSPRPLPQGEGENCLLCPPLILTPMRPAPRCDTARLLPPFAFSPHATLSRIRRNETPARHAWPHPHRPCDGGRPCSSPVADYFSRYAPPSHVPPNETATRHRWPAPALPLRWLAAMLQPGRLLPSLATCRGLVYRQTRWPRDTVGPHPRHLAMAPNHARTPWPAASHSMRHRLARSEARHLRDAAGFLRRRPCDGFQRCPTLGGGGTGGACRAGNSTGRLCVAPLTRRCAGLFHFVGEVYVIAARSACARCRARRSGRPPSPRPGRTAATGPNRRR